MPGKGFPRRPCPRAARQLRRQGSEPPDAPNPEAGRTTRPGGPGRPHAHLGSIIDNIPKLSSQGCSRLGNLGRGQRGRVMGRIGDRRTGFRQYDHNPVRRASVPWGGRPRPPTDMAARDGRPRLSPWGRRGRLPCTCIYSHCQKFSLYGRMLIIAPCPPFRKRGGLLQGIAVKVHL